jgi:hypothetical protein
MLSVILFYIVTPGILIKIKGNKYIIAIGHAILFSILFGVVCVIHQNNKEKLTNPSTTGCPGSAVHNKWGQGSECVQCPSINGVQIGAFPYQVTTEKGKWGFDGFCGFANNYDSNGNINTVIYPNECPINEITNINKIKDTPVYIPSYDPNLRFCLSNVPNRSINYSGFEKFNIVRTMNSQSPYYFTSI